MIDELTSFLTARLDELERDVSADPVETTATCPSSARANYKRQYILDDIAAKRKIIVEHGPETNDVGWGGTETTCRRCRYDSGLDTFTYGHCPTIKLLAEPFRWHPDYRHGEWKP